MYKIKLFLLCRDVKLCSVIKERTQNKDILKQVTEGIFTPKEDVVTRDYIEKLSYLRASLFVLIDKCFWMMESWECNGQGMHTAKER
jgi:hypothetical protein